MRGRNWLVLGLKAALIVPAAGIVIGAQGAAPAQE
jgi:hypothetical protein